MWRYCSDRSLVEASFVAPRMKVKGPSFPALRALGDPTDTSPLLSQATDSFTSHLRPQPNRTSLRSCSEQGCVAPCCTFTAPPSPSALSFLQEAFMVPKSGQLSGDGVPQSLVLPVPVLVMTSYPSGSPR